MTSIENCGYRELNPFLESGTDAMASALLGQPTLFSCSKYNSASNNSNIFTRSTSTSSNKRDRVISGLRWTCNLRSVVASSMGVGGGLAASSCPRRLGSPLNRRMHRPRGEHHGGDTGLGVLGFGNGGVAGAGAGADTARAQGRNNGASIGLSFGGLTSGAALDSSVAGVAVCEGPGGRQPGPMSIFIISPGSPPPIPSPPFVKIVLYPSFASLKHIIQHCHTLSFCCGITRRGKHRVV